ncbi:hypothetical protein B6N60_00323 [Richelia sinica FACHB-800]|uniref:Uncharacterized protein n=1 Tax=Richelia sinica FACHB-800 TaxID=1357546 RepID=A0A975Y306_9NOST|nr:hypothetical protein [Richelia sinica]MBD2665875.1 hypothetical protein [Richelia sinica FACHB-800]QXE21646.1 hypothetical protein B6N60_00323 [Richelia sinica FACHB-800]
MTLAGQQEDIQLLAETLQERLLADVPGTENFQVKCVVKNDELMVLVQHPPGVSSDTDTIFAIVEQGLQWQFYYQGQQAQCFIRAVGEKLPYAKQTLNLQVPKTLIQEETDIEPEIEAQEVILSPFEIPSVGDADPDIPITDDPFNTPIEEPILNNSFIDDIEIQNDIGIEPNIEAEEEKFDPFAGSSDLGSQKKPIWASMPLQAVAGAALLLAVLGGGSTYFLSRACIISECQEFQTAENIKSQSQKLIRGAKSEKQLQAVQKQIDDAISALQNIPGWSPRHGEAQELITAFSGQSTKISQVVNALQKGTAAKKKTEAPVKSLDDLRKTQDLWRQAITPLETIKPNNDLYSLAQSNLPEYQQNLQTVNQQLLKEETWLKKLDSVKAVANAATQSETTAKSSSDWQKVRSTWEVVVNNLKSIPQTSSGYEEARKLLTEYQPKLIEARTRATKETLAAKAYQQAVSAANQAKAYGSQNQWQAAVNSWQLAVQSVQQISQDSLYYKQAQPLIDTYSASLTQAKERLQLTNNVSQTRADLSSTCTNGIKFCTFTIEASGITVRLTPQYEQVLASNQAQMSNHYQSLQSALMVISDNARLPLVIYNSQGQQSYAHSPAQ